MQESRTISWSNRVVYGLDRPCQLKSVLRIPQDCNGQISLTFARGGGARYFGIDCRRRFYLYDRTAAENSNNTRELEENHARKACPVQVGRDLASQAAAMEQDGVAVAAVGSSRQGTLHDVTESLWAQMTRMIPPRMSRENFKPVDMSSERKQLQAMPAPSPDNSIYVSLRAQTNTGVRINFGCRKSF